MSDSKEQVRTFPHAMLREIYEQPKAIDDTLQRYIKDGALDKEVFATAREILRNHDEILITASGSSRHAGLAAEIMIEDMSGLSVDVEYASEYTYRSTHTLRHPATVVISQSGETADTLSALRTAQQRKHPTISITNHHHSSMAREAGTSLPTAAGVEKAVPATKSFTTQLVVLYLLSLLAAQERGVLSPEAIRKRIEQVEQLPEFIEKQLGAWETAIEGWEDEYRKAATFLFLGRCIHYAVAREGALKLKESSYMHAEGYPSGELKHGPNALVSPSVPLIVLATVDQSDPDSVVRYQKTVQLLEDLKVQGAFILAVTNEGDTVVPKLVNHTVSVLPTAEHLLPILEVIPLQLLAYFIATKNGVDVDHPRNLVKAVVTE
jgi:glucosamine--fructose-6-phosphate aminotransferase (isomerizing)